MSLNGKMEGVLMDGYKSLAYTYRKNGQEKKARVCDFLASCDDEDICTLFDSSAFNEIAKGYLQIALNELRAEEVLDEEQAISVRRRYTLLMSEKTATEVL